MARNPVFQCLAKINVMKKSANPFGRCLNLAESPPPVSKQNQYSPAFLLFGCFGLVVDKPYVCHRPK